MSERPTESDLNAFIEGALPNDEAAAIGRVLDAEPELRQQVEAMMRDRTALLSLDEPTLPRDFVAELEPLLARPLLVETETYKPGAARRRRRHVQRSKLARVAVMAAALLVVVTGGLWGALASGLSLGPIDDMLARVRGSEDQPAPEDVTAPAAPVDSVVREGAADPAELEGSVHHRRPTPLERVATTSSASPSPASPTEAPQHAGFALVVAANDVEQLLGNVLGEFDGRTTLVRNLTVQDALRIEQDWLLTADADPTTVASLRSRTDGQAHLRELARRVQQQRQVPGLPLDVVPSTGGPATGEVVLGDEDAMPSYEDQLDLSDQGATYTIAIRRADIDTLLTRLHGADASSALQLLASDDTPRSPLADRPAVIERMASFGDDDVVWLPIVVGD